MHDLILTFTGGLGAALVLGYLSHRLGLSPIVGYLLAGIVVSPHTPGYVADRHLAEQMAHIGVILLMFGVGLHFHFKELLAVKRIAVPGTIVQSAVATGLSMIVMRGFGWSWTEGAVFGMAIAVASTVVLTRVLVDNKHLHTPVGHIAIGWLVVEDIFTVFVLVLIPAIFGGGATGWRGDRAGDAVDRAEDRRAGRLHFRGRRLGDPAAADADRGSCSPWRSWCWRWGSRWERRSSSACRWNSEPSLPAWWSRARTSAAAPRPTRCR